jgi:hypothetical protein
LLRFADAVVLLRASAAQLHWGRVAAQLASPAAAQQALRTFAAVAAISR